jgi:Icc-related predicted phosphoesterase
MDFSWREEGLGACFPTAFLQPLFDGIRQELGSRYPRIFLIPGNDDSFVVMEEFQAGEQAGLWRNVHGRVVNWEGWQVMGYACIPPSPFMLKDWERYDVSRFVDPGSVSPEEGSRGDGMPAHQRRHATIADELEEMVPAIRDFRRTIFMSHCPPYDTVLDRAALDGRMVDHVPLDLHIGSIAVRRFLEKQQPALSLHGHVHESRSLTGAWQTRLGQTLAISAANESPHLALVRFDPEQPAAAGLELV